MNGPARLISALVLAGAWATGFVLAQAPAAPAPQTPAPAVQTPAPPAGARGRVGAPAGARRGGFAAAVRPNAAENVLVRGKALYDANCASCHAVDLRGSVDQKNPNLIRSGLALRDQQGELIGPAIARHTPRITLNEADSLAVSEHIHFMLSPAGRGGRGTPTLNVLVGDARAGEAQFQTLCASCHSVTGNLKGIATKIPEPRDLQNAWIAGSAGTFAGAGRGGDGGGNSTVIVTMANGSKLEGTLVRKNEFIVILILPDGTRRSIARNDGIPKIEVKDPQQAHKDMALKLAFSDPDNKKMHDITAYLATIK